MNDLTVFKNESFGEIRTLIINEEPWLRYSHCTWV